MKVKLKEDPREWRKTTLLTALGVVFISTLLHWRRVVSDRYWLVILAAMIVVAIAACFYPRWFRGFYRSSTRVGFYLSQALARVVLALIFLLLITPLSLLLRLAGKDPLLIKRQPASTSYWRAAKEPGSLDRLF